MRLYCKRHKQLNARLNKRKGSAPAVLFGHRDGNRLVRVAPGKRRPLHVVRYEQLLGRPLNGEEFVRFRNGNNRDWSMRNLQLISRAAYRAYLAYGRAKREAGLYGDR